MVKHFKHLFYAEMCLVLYVQYIILYTVDKIMINYVCYIVLILDNTCLQVQKNLRTYLLTISTIEGDILVLLWKLDDFFDDTRGL